MGGGDCAVSFNRALSGQGEEWNMLILTRLWVEDVERKQPNTYNPYPPCLAQPISSLLTAAEAAGLKKLPITSGTVDDSQIHPPA
jgi:hypothetical protein